MFRKTAIAAALGLAVSAVAQAQQNVPQEAIVTSDKLVDTYRWEVNAEYTGGEWSANGLSDTETDQFGVSGSFYFKPVDTTLGPRGEAAFLDHASDISLGYVYSEVDDNGIDIDGDRYNISGRYVMDAGFIFEGAYERNEPIDGEVDSFRLSAGYYLTETTTLIVDYADADVDNGGDTDGWNARVEHYWGFGGGNSGLKLEGNYGFINVDDADDIDLYGLSAIWYITHNIGVGASYDNKDFGILETERYSLFGEWFVTRNFAVNLAYNHAEPDDFDNDLQACNNDVCIDENNRLSNLDLEYDSITLGATLRF